MRCLLVRQACWCISMSGVAPALRTPCVTWESLLATSSKSIMQGLGREVGLVAVNTSLTIRADYSATAIQNCCILCGLRKDTFKRHPPNHFPWYANAELTFAALTKSSICSWGCVVVNPRKHQRGKVWYFWGLRRDWINDDHEGFLDLPLPACTDQDLQVRGRFLLYPRACLFCFYQSNRVFHQLLVQTHTS